MKFLFLLEKEHLQSFVVSIFDELESLDGGNVT